MNTALALLPASALLAASTQEAAPELAPFHRAEAELIGMDLWTRAGQDEGDRADLGDIQDFIIDPASGKVRGVVISSGGLGNVGDTLRRIEFSDLNWHTNTDGELEAWVKWTEEQFDEIPKFRPELLRQKATIDASSKVQRRSTDKDQEDEKEMAARDMPKGPRMPAVCMATKISGLDVFGPGELRSFATVSDVVLDCKEGSVAYLTVSYDDAEYLVPMGATKIRSVYTDPRPEEDELAVVAGMNKNGMRSAPKIDEEMNRTARHGKFREAVDRFYANVMEKSEDDPMRRTRERTPVNKKDRVGRDG